MSKSKITQYESKEASAAPATPRLQTSADTMMPAPDWKQARDELEGRLGGPSTRIRAFAATAPDSSGRENIVGFAVGLRYAARALTGELAVKVFVREKLPMDRVSKSTQVPREIAGMSTDVEAIGEIIPQSYTARYPRPVPCGVSTSNIKLPGSGTIGCLVLTKDGKLCMLSNNHVFANENAALVGDEIIQPGNAEPADGANAVIGTLDRFVPIQATGNLVDAAIALTSFTLVSPKHVTYQLNPEPLEPTIGMTVMKNGRTTQSTVGMVTDLHVNITVGYDPFPAGAEMRDQIAVRGISGSFSMPGDSGSLIVTAASKQPVALLFAGSSDNGVTFGSPISAVMSALDIERFVAQVE